MCVRYCAQEHRPVVMWGDSGTTDPSGNPAPNTKRAKDITVWVLDMAGRCVCVCLYHLRVRSISLPAGGVVGSRLCAMAVGGYARLRKFKAGMHLSVCVRVFLGAAIGRAPGYSCAPSLSVSLFVCLCVCARVSCVRV
jgi:hypothetical protein